jgi:hypothetical protein
MKKASGPKKKIKFGTQKGKIKIIDPDWWKPMTDAEVDVLLSEDDDLLLENSAREPGQKPHQGNKH